MRLLEILPNGDYRLTEELLDNAVPQYAILSHTWGHKSQEMTFEDMTEGKGRDKSGYEKIKFCGERAAEDRLQYFWVDSCCIKKSSDAELSESLNSMFRWYQRAAKCYVYLSDVSTKRKSRGENMQVTWEQSFRKSKWFTRGWTLQELLAPSSVEFFSRECKRLGDKQSLAQQISMTTGVPISALQNSALSQFSIDQKFKWARNRQTTREEDWAYALLGIFKVSMSVIYGEGRSEAVRRLRKEITEASKDRECLQHLFVTDPRLDKIRIEQTKGGLLRDSYNWMLEHNDFKQWRGNQHSHLLWIKGDPGKGKTMLLCGIVDELQKLKAETHLLSFFYCQATDSRINSATAVLRGLLYLLIDQQPSLISHVQKRHDHAGKTLFEGANTWIAISDIFTNVLQDPSLRETYLVIDALDECTVGLSELLDFITQKSSLSSQVKWLVSSRNWPPIEERLGNAENKVRLCLELNAKSVSAAVGIYIRHKVSQLAQEKKYDEKTEDAILNHLFSNANNTFLWVALVCQNLQTVKPWHVSAKLNDFPPGLDSLYGRMMEQINCSVDADLCKRILATISILYRPVTLKELPSLVDMPESIAQNLNWLAEIIGFCGSFLTTRGDTIYFVHQSAKDYLSETAYQHIFPHGIAELHFQIHQRSLAVLGKTLRREIYGLRAPGILIEEVPDLRPPLSAVAYSSRFWIDHLCQVDKQTNTEDPQCTTRIQQFLNSHFLHWLEALSLAREAATAIVALRNLENWLTDISNMNAHLLAFINDAYRFALFHRDIIEKAPLQVYISCLLFSPSQCLVREQFRHEEPKWITLKPLMEHSWSSCLQVLEGHTGYIYSVAYSPDGRQLASGSYDNTVRLWDAATGACQSTLEGHTGYIYSAAYSPDGRQLASGSHDNTVRLWDAATGACQSTLEGHTGYIYTVAYSPDGRQLASGSDDNTVRLWDAATGACQSTLEGHTGSINSVAYSPDGRQLASCSDDNTVRLWDAATGACQSTLEGHTGSIYSVAYSPDGRQLASCSYDNTVRLWDAATGACQSTLEGHTGSIYSVAYSPDGRQLASGSDDNTVRLWDAATGACQSTLEGHTDSINSVAYSPDGRQLASCSYDNTVRLWDAATGACQSTLEGHTDSIYSVAYSPDGRQLASGSYDNTVRLWDAATGACQSTLEGHTGSINSVAYSPDGRQLASGSHDNTVRLWDAATGACQSTLEGHIDSINSVAYSPDGRQLASGSDDNTVRLWDAATGACQSTLEGHTDSINSVAYSPDGRQLASCSYDNTVRLWDAATGACQSMLEGHTSYIYSVAYSPDGRQLASCSYDNTVRLWDAATGACQSMLEGHTGYIYSMAYSPDGRQLASCSYDNTVRLWDAATGACQSTLEGHTGYIYSVAYSPDGRQLASGSHDNTVRLWDAATGACQSTLEGHTGYIYSVACSPDGRQLASGSYDNTVRLWDAATGACQSTLEGHTGSINSVAYSPDGRQLASGSYDNTVRLWDAATGACQSTSESSTTSVTFGPHGSTLITDFGTLAAGYLSQSDQVSEMVSFGVKNKWITRNDRNVIWLPLEYRPSASAVRENCVAVGCQSGVVYMLNFCPQVYPVHSD